MLYLVATPIGNLGDITYRAVEVLRKVDKILAEDTRRSSILLKHYQIVKPLISYHAYNEHHLTPKLITELKNEQSMALISDAGMPGIADPAYLMVKACIEHNIVITCLPGACALITALTLAGLEMQSFIFEAFLPPKKGRQKRLERLSQESRTIILYESPHRLQRTLEDLRQHLGPERRASLCRELTKTYEEIRRGTLYELNQYYKLKKPKGEYVIVLAGKLK